MRMHSDPFPTDIHGLPEARASASHALAEGERFDLRIAPVVKRIGEASVRMLAYNGSVPGPTLRVQQGSEVEIEVLNEGDLEATVHWHGLRIENAYDGTSATQRPMQVGERFRYRLTFPDPGVYWYHPHIREDYGQEMGLYGAIVVAPSDADYWPPADRELTLTLDDILIEEGKLAPFERTHATHTAMGRFGNVLLTNGEALPSLTAKQGEVVRLYLTNTANARVFDVALPGARMKLVGGDSGHLEREQLVESVLIAPSERAVVDVLFSDAGSRTLEHRTPKRTYVLATFAVAAAAVEPSRGKDFAHLRTNRDMVLERQLAARYLTAEPDKSLSLVAEMELGHAETGSGYVCPMHPEVRSEEPGRCPECRMKLVPAHLVGQGEDHQGHAAAHQRTMADSHGHAAGHQGTSEHSPVHAAAPQSGIEWEDDMAEMNRRTTSSTVRWKLIDRSTGAEGAAIDWRFRVGDRVKIRLVNETDSDHPMHHPFHIHGAGRFLVLSRDGVAEPNLVWKDTVLVQTGQTVDLLLEVTHAGRWMAHCHIAEHHEAGMMLHFDVSP